MIHAENERSFETALRGMAYPLTIVMASPTITVWTSGVMFEDFRDILASWDNPVEIKAIYYAKGR